MSQLQTIAVSVVLILLSACGPQEKADLVSGHGVEIFWGDAPEDRQADLTAQMATEMETQLLSGLKAYGYRVPDLNGARVHWRAEFFKCHGSDNQDKTCAGEAWLSGYIELTTFECAWRSAYRHELLHFIQGNKAGVTDNGHKRPEWALVRDDSVWQSRCPQGSL